ncbi:uncharacterized protein B0I36DRAFT_2709 [Microdochium trichocladiopsis]|uniref:NAD(P)-binding domain-containing protein n=1 Tax=Microdochium trichocladiopsis TaxID=1682393 RepID=A0A9P8YDJ2_9PEZI|nr:uncharacterized protein B0I36DRAFT_2709 [Microdochium trichocladiopsis]KAH7039827.1 hypothetical protein B0I36DRAFT_2709 [Microdochium trichocladiopsis]
MSAKKVLVTGASGFIGGDALYALEKAHPTWKFSVLVRSKETGAKIKKVHPNVELVIGSLDDFETVSNAAAAADIVLHTADSSDHQGAARAIAAGLRKSHSAQNPGYYIHVSGTGILCWYDADNKRYGEPPLPEQIYNDVEGVDDLLNLPDSAFHRDVDKIVLEEAAKDPAAVRITIVCPPTIYGVGRGPVNPKSRQIPLLIESTFDEGLAPISGRGLAEWHYVHVYDLSALFVILADHASAGKPIGDSGKEIWGPRAYFLAEDGIFQWGAISKLVAYEAYKQGAIEREDTKQFSYYDATAKGKFDWVSWGQNSRGVSERARKYLGWQPKQPSLVDSIPELVRLEIAARKQRESK